jgi:hypothetical protein
MIKGGGKAKGSNWERAVGTTLSLWVSEGARSDLFARTVLSGGQFTISKINEGIPGDLMANNPLAFVFMELFSVECKAYKDIGLDKYIWDTAGKSFLAKTYKLAKDLSTKIGVSPLVVAKQNHQPAIVIMDYNIGVLAIKHARTKAFRFHSLHNNYVMLVSLDHLVKLVRVKPFLENVKTRHIIQ